MGNSIETPTYYQIGEQVKLDFGGTSKLSNVYIDGVKIDSGNKVTYDIKVPVGSAEASTIIKDVDGQYITANVLADGQMSLL